MTDPRLPGRAFARLGFLVAVALAATAARAGETGELSQFPCGPLEQSKQFARAMGGGEFIALTNDQWRFVEGLFVMAPDTPASLPPGDRAAMSMRPDGSASIVFIDGELACAPIKLPPEAVKVIMQVGSGDLVHAGSGL
jgi:hypothetical protein